MSTLKIKKKISLTTIALLSDQIILYEDCMDNNKRFRVFPYQMKIYVPVIIVHSPPLGYNPFTVPCWDSNPGL